jgi:elongation factor Ts
MHIAASDPRFVARDEVTGGDLEAERRIYRQQALDEGKPEKIVDRIVDGRVEKYYGQTVLLEQPFVKDSDKTVGEMIAEKIATIGENIQIRRFNRYVLGEGLEKRQDDFAAEVAAASGAGKA